MKSPKKVSPKKTTQKKKVKKIITKKKKLTKDLKFKHRSFIDDLGYEGFALTNSVAKTTETWKRKSVENTSVNFESSFCLRSLSSDDNLAIYFSDFSGSFSSESLKECETKIANHVKALKKLASELDTHIKMFEEYSAAFLIDTGSLPDKEELEKDTSHIEAGSRVLDLFDLEQELG